MKFITHRRNTLQDLAAAPREHGIEVDIRCSGDNLIIHHDPFTDGELFERWIAQYQHGTLILNVKEEGMEERLIALMQKHGIDDYFFLDQSIPFLIKWANAGERHCAVCYSDYEPVENALSLAGKVDWVWVNGYNRYPLNAVDAHKLHEAGFKICLASPELHGYDPVTEIPAICRQMHNEGYHIDAVCTKRADLWQQALADVQQEHAQ